MNETLLAQLRDITQPVAIAIWPPAFGWWLLGAIIILALLYALLKSMPWLRSLSYRWAAIKALELLYAEQNNPSQRLAGINNILRRVVRIAYPQRHAAGLSGRQWLLFLDHSAQMNAFVKGEAKVLVTEAYKPQPKIKDNMLYPIIRRWLWQHRSIKSL